MNNRFRLGISFFVFFVVIFSGMSIIRLFSWNSLLLVDKIFYSVSAFLFVFALYLSFYLSKLDDVPMLPDLDGVPTKDIDKIVKQGQDMELEELRKEIHKPTPVNFDSPHPDGLLRPSNGMSKIPSDVLRMADDVSMYTGDNRNIIKPPPQKEYIVEEKEDNNEYRDVF